MSDYFLNSFFSKKFITSGSSLDPGFSNNGSKKLRAGDDTSEREKCKSDLICKDNDGQAPSIITIILMTGNLEAYYTDRKEYRKTISGKYGKNLFEFLGGDASFTRQD